MTSPDAFLIFSKFCFSGLLGGDGIKGQKMAQNDKKNLLNSVSQELHFIWLWLLVHMCKMIVFFKVYQKMPKGNFEVCPTFFTCVTFITIATFCNIIVSLIFSSIKLVDVICIVAVFIWYLEFITFMFFFVCKLVCNEFYDWKKNYA